jgi:hypothetical protein
MSLTVSLAVQEWSFIRQAKFQIIQEREQRRVLLIILLLRHSGADCIDPTRKIARDSAIQLVDRTAKEARVEIDARIRPNAVEGVVKHHQDVE